MEIRRKTTMTSPLHTWLEKLRSVGEKSSEVCGWWPYPEDGTIRGPFHRWFKCQEGDVDHQEKLASVEDDVKFFSTAANEFNSLLKINEILLGALSEAQEALELIWSRNEDFDTEEGKNAIFELAYKEQRKARTAIKEAGEVLE